MNIARWRLRTQLMVSLALAAVTPTAILGALVIGHVRRDVEQEVLRGNLALIRTIGHQLNATLQDTRRAMLVAAAAWGAELGRHELLEATSQPTVSRVLRHLRSEFSLLRSLALFDRDGKHVSGDTNLKITLDLANSYGGHVSEVIFGPDGLREVMMVVQARDRRGVLVGFLAARVDLGFVAQRLSEARLGPGASLLVVDGSGRLVAASSGQLPVQPRKNRSLRDAHPGVDRVLATHTEGQTNFADRSGKRWITVYRNIAGMSEFRAVRWGVVLSQPAEQAYALARRTTRDTLLVASAVLLLALAVGAWLARRMTRPLGLLVERTDRVGAGSLDAGDKHPASMQGGSAEIALLSGRFVQMVDRLRESRESLYALTEFQKNLVQSIPFGVISVDHEGVIRSINRAQQKLSDVDERVIGRPLAEAFGAEDEAGIFSYLRNVLDGGPTVDLTLDKKPTPFTSDIRLRYRLRLSALRQPDGGVGGAVIVQEDLSERAQLEAQLIRSERLGSVGTLAAGVAHEINNPLTTILGYAKLLLESCPAESPDRPALSLVADEAERVRGIVAALLDFSRQEAGEVRPVDLNGIAERTLSLALPTLRKREVAVERQLAEELPTTNANDKQLGQVFYNLINNAAQAMPDGGTLTVRTGADARWVFAEFTDEGEGIAAEDLEHVFDPFFTTKGPTEGTGLGLAVCHQIIERHGGRIDVDSTLGKGTTFRLQLLRTDDYR